MLANRIRRSFYPSIPAHRLRYGRRMRDFGYHYTKGRKEGRYDVKTGMG